MITAIIEMLCNGFLFFALHLKNSGSFPPPLKAEDERKHFEKMKNGDTQSKNILIEHNLRLVSHIIKKYYSNCSEQEDLISIGTIGLIKAINTFDYEKGARLATYASRCIENEILMYFRAQKKIAQDVSMSDPIGVDCEGNPLTLSDVIFSEDTVVDDVDKNTKINKLVGLVKNIKDEREREIIICRYGLFGTEPMTQREIAKKAGISRSYVSRIEKKTLEKLRKELGE